MPSPGKDTHAFANWLIDLAASHRRFFPRGAMDLEPLALQALLTIHVQSPARIGELATRLQVPTEASISHAVASLYRDGLARDVPDVGDRRVRLVEPTAKGRKLIAEFIETSRPPDWGSGGAGR